MNKISKCASICSSLKIGKNNLIGKNVKIFENVIIGDNNKIYDDTIIYPNTKIGNNNFFHVDNIVFNGYDNKTIIGDYNKFLSEVYISHDNVIHNNVTFYPRVFSAGIVEYFNNSNIGANACIHQRCKIGNYSMIGMNSTITKNVFPFYIIVNNKYLRINTKAIPDDFNINNYKEQLDNIIDYLKHNDNDCKIKKEINTLPKEISEIINNFLSKLFSNKI